MTGRDVNRQSVFILYFKKKPKKTEVPSGINSAITLDDIEFRGDLVCSKCFNYLLLPVGQIEESTFHSKYGVGVHQ